MLGVLGATLTFVGLIVGTGGQPLVELFQRHEGLSEDNLRETDEIKKLGGDAHFLDRTPGLFGLFGGRDLISIGIHGRSFGDESLARLVKTYGDHLAYLEITNTGITDADLRHLAGLPYLRDLRIGNINPRHAVPGAVLPLNTITDAGLVHLRGLTKLGVLDLGGLPVTDEGLDVLKDLPNLGGLYLGRTKVRGTWLGRLKSLPGLAVVYLDGSAITDDGLSYLKGASNLQFLSLAGVPLTGRGLTHLKTLPKLNTLDIQGCGLSFEDMDNFLVACPSVKLE